MLVTNKILAIDPGTRAMGLAVLEGNDLLYHGVKVFTGPPPERQTAIRHTIRRFVLDFKPDVMVVEKTFFGNTRHMSLLNALGDEIQAIGQEQNITVWSIAANTVKKTICGDGRASKQELAQAIAKRYPELKVYLNQDRKWKDAHFANAFDAIGLAIVASITDTL